MTSFEVLSSTREDQRLYCEARLVEVQCLDCTAVARVKKNSEHHTSVQWTHGSPEACPEFRRQRASTPPGRPLYAACARMTASIERGVQEGRVPIGADDGY